MYSDGVKSIGAILKLLMRNTPENKSFELRIAEIEKQYLTQALVRATGVRTKAAELLKMSYRSFRHYAQKHQI